MSSITSLLLTRHGQSTWNADGRWQGQADPPLSDLGREQARTAAGRIGTVDLIVTSPQQRAAMTAAIISEFLGIGPLVVVDDLRERHAGPWSGLTRDEIEEEWPGWLEQGKRPDGYELDSPLSERVDTALREVVSRHAGASILVVCHGGVVRTFEADNGIAIGRVPNLSGRHVTAHHGATVEWSLGEQVQLLDEDLITGGERDRV